MPNYVVQFLPDPSGTAAERTVDATSYLLRTEGSFAVYEFRKDGELIASFQAALVQGILRQ